MKKIIAIMLMVVITSFNFVYANEIIEDDFDDITDGWNVSAVPEGNSGASVKNGELSLWFNTNNETGKSVASKTFSFGGEIINIGFKAKVDNLTSSNLRKVTLLNAGTFNLTELLRFEGSELLVFGEKVDTEIAKDTFYNILISVNPETKDGAVWIDSELKYNKNLGGKWKKFDFSNLSLEFCNYTKPSVSTMQSDFNIDDLYILDSGKKLTSIPTDNAQFVRPEIVSKINIDFGGQMSPTTYKKDNFVLYENDIPMDFDITSTKSTVDITPTGGFSEEKTYKVEIKEVLDVFLKTQDTFKKTITFKTAPIGYIPPSITITNSDTQIYEGNTLNIVATSQTKIAKVEFLVNDILEKTIEDSQDYSFIFDKPQGEYNVKAIGYDSFGGYSYSNEIVITVLSNNAPTVSFENLVNMQSYQSKELTAVTIIAEDSDGLISKVELFVQDVPFETFTQKPYVVDLSNIGKGDKKISAIATDNVGAKALVTSTISITGDITYTTVYENDMEKFLGGVGMIPTGSGALYGDCIISSSKDYGENHGKVAVMETLGKVVENVNASGSYMRFPTTAISGDFVIETDLYIENVGKEFYFMLKEDGVMQLAIDVGFTDTDFYFKGNKDGKTTYIPYKKGQWYNLRYEVNNSKHTYDAYLNSKLVADDYTISNKTLKTIDTRFILQLNANDEKAKIAFDNISVILKENEPIIESITYDEVSQCDKIKPRASKINITLSTPLLPSSVNKDSVKILGKNGEVILKNVICEDNKITAQLAEELFSNSEYEIIITTKAKKANNKPLLEEITQKFQTAYYDFDVSDFKIISDNEKIHVEGNIVNQTTDLKNAYIIINVFENEKLVDMMVKEVKEASNGSYFKTNSINKKSNQELEVYLWDSLENPIPIILKK